MDVITFDIPLLIIGIASLIWFRLFRPTHVFQVACQFFGTFWAQYTFGVTWSLGRLAPFLSASSLSRVKVRFAKLFFPFVAYVVFAGLVLSFFWKIPAGVDFFYAEGRIWIQLFVFLSIMLSVKAFAVGMLHRDGPVLLWKALTFVMLIHGLASLYQYLAVGLGYPLIGISRSHGETGQAGVADVAAFGVGDELIYRPGGLAGEPKTAAILFGIYFISHLLSASPLVASRNWKRLARLSFVLSVFGFFAAFSTSAFVGALLVPFLALPLYAMNKRQLFKYFMIVFFSIVVFITAYFVLTEFSGIDLVDLMMNRTIERFDMNEIDPPILAALSVIWNDPVVLFFGTGIGGGSFSIMEYLNTVYQYAFAPNVGMVLFLLEFGLVGSLLLLVPFALLTLKISTFIRNHRVSSSSDMTQWTVKFLFIVGVSTMCFILSGSGISMGFPLALGCLLAAAQISEARA